MNMPTKFGSNWPSDSRESFGWWRLPIPSHDITSHDPFWSGEL